eukprot:9446424-Alexandrium_andersonii.AAC.1
MNPWALSQPSSSDGACESDGEAIWRDGTRPQRAGRKKSPTSVRALTERAAEAPRAVECSALAVGGPPEGGALHFLRPVG